MPAVESTDSARNRLAFWILGLCNNFAYVIMLSAAEDILSVAEGSKTPSKGVGDPCQKSVVRHHCQLLSTGSVLLANILPSLIVKLFYPFVMHPVPFGIRHVFIVSLQICSFIMVAFSQNVAMSLSGVVLASIGAGLGEVTFLSLTSYFPNYVVGAWSSGTGGAGIFGSFTYALLTDKRMLGLLPQNTLLTMLIIPFFFAVAYWKLLPIPSSLHRVSICVPSTYFISFPDSSDDSVREVPVAWRKSFKDKLAIVKVGFMFQVNSTPSNDFLIIHFFQPLILKYMFPLALVYLAEYFINQGLLQLLIFDCEHSFGIGQYGQYRWYQVLYQLGVFISRSSVEVIHIPSYLMPLIPILQVTNALFLLWDALEQFIPHVAFVFVVVIYEGLLGGAAYANTFHLLHKSVIFKHKFDSFLFQTESTEKKELSLGFVSISDSFGIVCAGFLAIPAHNYICSKPN
ncbi:unnamed protein product [Thelazia callipaeda]|uniref:Battenin n=1 Tax=Thelazia callipaeda TaxID=103827 RepID=A0A0N5DBX2_THECL|nr:unnamed protein product [Thelazia callipaeda]